LHRRSALSVPDAHPPKSLRVLRLTPSTGPKGQSKARQFKATGHIKFLIYRRHLAASDRRKYALRPTRSWHRQASFEPKSRSGSFLTIALQRAGRLDAIPRESKYSRCGMWARRAASARLIPCALPSAWDLRSRPWLVGLVSTTRPDPSSVACPSGVRVELVAIKNKDAVTDGLWEIGGGRRGRSRCQERYPALRARAVRAPLFNACRTKRKGQGWYRPKRPGLRIN